MKEEIHFSLGMKCELEKRESPVPSPVYHHQRRWMWEGEV